MALTCVIFEIKRDNGRNLENHIFIPLTFDAPVREVTVGILPTVWYGITRIVWLHKDEKKFEDVFSRFDV